jgi:hypothetical protein
MTRSQRPQLFSKENRLRRPYRVSLVGHGGAPKSTRVKGDAFLRSSTYKKEKKEHVFLLLQTGLVAASVVPSFYLTGLLRQPVTRKMDGLLGWPAQVQLWSLPQIYNPTRLDPSQGASLFFSSYRRCCHDLIGEKYYFFGIKVVYPLCQICYFGIKVSMTEAKPSDFYLLRFCLYSLSFYKNWFIEGK